MSVLGGRSNLEMDSEVRRRMNWREIRVSYHKEREVTYQRKKLLVWDEKRTSFERCQMNIGHQKLAMLLGCLILNASFEQTSRPRRTSSSKAEESLDLMMGVS
jgi:hypothetical protein